MRTAGNSRLSVECVSPPWGSIFPSVSTVEVCVPSVEECVPPVVGEAVCVGLGVVQADFNELGQFCGGNSWRRQLRLEPQQLHLLSFLQQKAAEKWISPS